MRKKLAIVQECAFFAHIYHLLRNPYPFWQIKCYWNVQKWHQIIYDMLLAFVWLLVNKLTHGMRLF